MNKKMSLVVVLCLSVLAVSVVAALVQFMSVHMCLTVPAAPGLQWFEADGVTPIMNSTDVSTLFAWTGTQFTWTFVLKNVGNIPLNTSFAMNPMPSGWSFSFSGNGSLASGANQTVTMNVFPLNLMGGTTSGDFNLEVFG